MTPEQRRLRAQIAAHTMHSKHDSRETSRRGRERFLERFEEQVDPDGVLAPQERARRAAAARSAYFKRLALKSSRARSAKKARA